MSSQTSSESSTGNSEHVPHFPRHEERLEDVVTGSPRAEPAVIYYGLGTIQERDLELSEPGINYPSCCYKLTTL